jgi:hypothetical protein
MKIHILAVGSELLTPFFRDTDSLYLTQRLNDLGLEVSAKVTIGDEIENLRLAGLLGRRRPDVRHRRSRTHGRRPDPGNRGRSPGPAVAIR